MFILIILIFYLTWRCFTLTVTKVFWYAIAICITIVLWGAFFPDNLNDLTASLTAIIADNFAWFYVVVILLLIAFAIFLMFSRFGEVKLGKDTDEPDFTLPAWFAMLFSAGMGIGLMFFTTAETISHAFISTPNAPPGSEQAIMESLQYTSLHWGLHGWGLYSVVALVLAYFKFRIGAPGLISATLIPLLGEKRINGFIGTLIDTLAVFATIVGVASTLGLGSAQINSGLTYLFDAPKAFWFQMIILAIATVLFIISAWSGLGRGIRYLSTINMSLATVLIILLFIVGPSIYIIEMFITTTGNYLTNFIQMSFDLKPTDVDHKDWLNDWTIFYWAWWISWAPFVGMFIARVSKGRTVKEFIAGVLLAPTLVTMLFFAVFGSSALNLENLGITQLSQLETETVTFGMFEQYPLGTVLSLITIVVIAIFFITSADSATFVLGMFTTGGKLNPSNKVKITWGIILSAMAAIVMYSGGIEGFQNMLIIAALPLSLIVVSMVVSFYLTINKHM